MDSKTFFILVLLSQSVMALGYTDLPELNLTIGSPSYQLIWNYNLLRNSLISGSPQGTTLSQSSGYKDAWIKILTLDNVIHDSELNSSFASRQGNVLTKYGYTPTCPPEDYCWPSCVGTRYELAGSSETFSLYVNGQPQGNSIVEAYTVSNTSANLNLTAQLTIETYCRKYKLRWVYDKKGKPEYCAEWDAGVETFKGTIADRQYYGLTDLKPQANVTFSRIALDISEVSRGKLALKTSAPYSNLSFYVGNNSISFSGNAYDIGYYYPDYNFLRISTYGLPRITQYGLFSNVSRTRNNVTGEVITEFYFTLTYAETEAMLESKKCKLVIQDLFQKEYVLDKLCQTDWKQPITNASTSGLIFSDKDKVNVSVLLTYNGVPIPDKQIVVRYAGSNYTETTDSKGTAEFIIQAEYPNNNIEVEFSGDEDYLSCSKTLMIATMNSRAEDLLWLILPALFVLIITGYGAYKMLKFLGG